MRSVADELKREDRARVAALSPEERIALSLKLADAAIEVLRSARGLSRAEAVALARSVRHRGRRPSQSATGFDGPALAPPPEAVELWRRISDEPR